MVKRKCPINGIKFHFATWYPLLTLLSAIQRNMCKCSALQNNCARGMTATVIFVKKMSIVVAPIVSSAFVTSPTKRGCSGWAFIPCSCNDFGLTWLPHSRYSWIYLMWIRTFFLPPARRGLRGHPYKALQGKSHRRRRGSAFWVRVEKYWNKLPTSVVTAHSVNIFKKRLDISLSPSPPQTER